MIGCFIEGAINASTQLICQVGGPTEDVQKALVWALRQDRKPKVTKKSRPRETRQRLINQQSAPTPHPNGAVNFAVLEVRARPLSL
jgi:hypothetical protein